MEIEDSLCWLTTVTKVEGYSTYPIKWDPIFLRNIDELIWKVIKPTGQRSSHDRVSLALKWVGHEVEVLI